MAILVQFKTHIVESSGVFAGGGEHVPLGRQMRRHEREAAGALLR